MHEHCEVEESLSGIGERDHSTTSEYRIFGPPGTGKTTNLTRQIRRAVEKFGKDSVLVTSFSRAAAAELAGQHLPLSPDRVGTLHSYCWHALGRPHIAEVHTEEWNARNPSLRITPLRASRKLDGEQADEDLQSHTVTGDYWLGELNRARGLKLSPTSWPRELREFAANWNQYKISTRTMDFCDLIETASHEISFAPKRPDVILADEAQDLNPMQLQLVRKWGDHAQYFILAADDDQTIYSWCGATPDAVLDPPIPDDHKIVLKQSYRVPRSIHKRADWLIRQVSRREEKLYEARAEHGLLMHLSHGGYKSPEYWILKTLTQHVDKGETVMLLTSCSYMLHPVIAVLRKSGIPFHNPFRKSNGFWNPLRSGLRESSVSRLLALLSAGFNPQTFNFGWTNRDLKLWTEWLRPKASLREGARALIDEAEPTHSVTIDRLVQLFEADVLQSLLIACEDPRQLSDWWCRRVAPEFQSRVQFASLVVSARGAQTLKNKPQVTVGTIHSVKGGEADAVFLFPDLSKAGDAAYQRYGPQRDAVIRLFYVGMTRARETLYICQRDSPMAVTL